MVDEITASCEAVPHYLQPENGIYGQIGKVILVLGENFGTQRGTCYVHQIFSELDRVITGKRKQ